MKIPFIASLIIHALIIVLISFGVHNPFSKKLKDKGYTVFEFKEIGPKSRAPVISQKEGHISKEKAQRKEKEESKVKKTEMKQQNMPTEEKKQKKELSDKINKKKDKQKPVKKAEKPELKEKKIVNLKENKASISKEGKKKTFDSVLDDAMAKISDGENTGVKAEEVGPVLTATQVDLIRQTIRKCWHFPAGLKNAEELLVDIRMELLEDGTVKKAEIVDKNRMKSDPNFKVAAENAYRAVLDPECNPLPLPKEKYEEWKNLELTFNPKEMFD
ncbi:MAG: cell envelope integrity protein TolA [Holosporales bacterium]|jgi:hypothetical protein|nr:cell envelope integrity protein TolA [Holosporales bacterium]